jgi:uncharacterized membrane protein
MASDQVNIVVATFATEDGAAKALPLLQSGNAKAGNAAVISRGDDGKLEVRETHDWGMGKGALVGAAAALLLPGIGLLAGAAAGAIGAKLTDFGFPDDDLKRLGQGLTPDSSALVVAVEDPARAEVERVLRQAGGQVVSGGLNASLAAQLEASG